MKKIKLKTKKSISKRISLTKKKGIKYKQPFKSHLALTKNGKRTRRLKSKKVVSNQRINNNWKNLIKNI